MAKTIDELFEIEKIFENIKTLALYLSLDEQHSVSRKFGYITQILSMKGKDFILNSSIDGETIAKDCLFNQISYVDLFDFVENAKKQKPSEIYKNCFKNKWDEIEKTTKMNFAINKMKDFG